MTKIKFKQTTNLTSLSLLYTHNLSVTKVKYKLVVLYCYWSFSNFLSNTPNKFLFPHSIFHLNTVIELYVYNTSVAHYMPMMRTHASYLGIIYKTLQDLLYRTQIAWNYVQKDWRFRWGMHEDSALAKKRRNFMTEIGWCCLQLLVRGQTQNPCQKWWLGVELFLN